LEKAKTEKEADGEFNSHHPGYCGAQDTFYVGNLMGVGRIYQQTFIDTYAKVAFAKVDDRKTPLTDKIFYFADAWAGEIWAYDFDIATGVVSNRRTFTRIDATRWRRSRWLDGRCGGLPVECPSL
jgi:hypothetical protein